MALEDINAPPCNAGLCLLLLVSKGMMESKRVGNSAKSGTDLLWVLRVFVFVILEEGKEQRCWV